MVSVEEMDRCGWNIPKELCQFDAMYIAKNA